MKKKSFLKRVRVHFFQGLFYAMPVYLTAYVLYLAVSTVSKALWFATFIIPEDYHLGWALKPLTILAAFSIILLVIFVTGWAVQTFIGARLEKWFENAMTRLPVIKSIYWTLRQIFENIFAKKEKAFSQACIVEFPAPGQKAVGFVTGEALGALRPRPDIKYFKVFVPTSPNPTGGFLLIVPEDKMELATFSAEAALKLIVSGGIIDV